jgi:hypothetical protein
MLSIDGRSKLTESEAYNSNEELLDVALTFGNGSVVAGKEFALFQNEPNPFETYTMISFTLPEAMDATLTVFDVTGKLVHGVEGTYTAGFNQIRLNRKDLRGAGVLYYRLDAEGFTASRKMVVID